MYMPLLLVAFVLLNILLLLVEYFYLYNLVTNNITHCNRGHAYKLFKDRFRLDIRQFFFMCRVVKIWNSLDANVVNALIINQFIQKLNILI